MTKSFSTLLSLATYDPESQFGIKPAKMNKILNLLKENYGRQCVDYIKSCFDWDEDDKVFYPHMDPGEALLDWLEPAVMTKISGGGFRG